MKTIPLSRTDVVAVVDDEDYDTVMAAGPWHLNPHKHSSYARRSVRRADGVWTTQGLHNFLTGWRFVDHRNGDGLDNRRTNLRPASRSQNASNGRHRRNRSGFKGVTPGPAGKRWKAEIRGRGQYRYLGLFETAEAAAKAYDAAALDLFGEYAHINFPAPTRPAPQEMTT